MYARAAPSIYSRGVTVRGFVYAPRAGGSPLLDAGPGELVAHPRREPPWIVVNHSLPKIIVVSWPGRLVAVEVTDPVTQADLAAMQRIGVGPEAGYTNAIGVRVLEEVAQWRLFGAHGEAVVEIIETAQRLDVATATALAEAVDPDAPDAYAAAWDAWLVAEEPTLSARNRAGSPIHQGFSVIARELRKRALAVTDGAAVVVDEDGESSLVAPWGAATHALLYAAMALGAPHLVAEADRARLLRAWQATRP